MEEQETDRVKFQGRDQVVKFVETTKQMVDDVADRAVDEATTKHAAAEQAAQPTEDTRPAWKVALDNMSLSSEWDLQTLIGSLSEALSAVSVLMPPPLPPGKSRASVSATVRSGSKAPSELLAAARAAAAADEEARLAAAAASPSSASSASSEAVLGAQLPVTQPRRTSIEQPTWRWAWPWEVEAEAAAAADADDEEGAPQPPPPPDLPATVGPGVYLRGASMPNSPARSLSEWRRSHASPAAPPTSDQRREALDAANKMLDLAMRSREEEMKRRRDTRKELKRLKLIPSKSAHKIVAPDAEGEYDQAETRGEMDAAVSQWSLANPSEELRKARKILRDIDLALERVQIRTRVLAWKQANVTRPLEGAGALAEEEETGPGAARRERARRWSVEHSPLRAMQRRRRTSLLADERVLAIRNEIARRVARIEEAGSRDTLTPERLTYAYVVRKLQPVVGDAMVGLEPSPPPPRAAGAGAGAEAEAKAGLDLDAVAALVAAASAPGLVDQVRSLTVPLAVKEAGAVEEVAMGEPPRTATATGDELSPPSSPLRRLRVRRHRGRRSLRQRTSHAPPSRSSSSSSAASVGESGLPVDQERELLRRILLRDDELSPDYSESFTKPTGRKYVPMKMPFYKLPPSTLQEMGMGRRVSAQR